MMNENLYILASLFTGTLLGFIFFGGLWLTTNRILSSKNPALWILGSFIVRTAITLTGFYYVSTGNWKRMLICLLGFIIARILTNRFLLLDKTTGKKEIQNEA